MGKTDKAPVLRASISEGLQTITKSRFAKGNFRCDHYNEKNASEIAVGVRRRYFR